MMNNDKLNEAEMKELYESELYGEWMRLVEMTLETLKMKPNRTENEEKC